LLAIDVIVFTKVEDFINVIKNNGSKPFIALVDYD
jgi:hypothetical protein